MSYSQPFYPFLLFLTALAVWRHSRHCSRHRALFLALPFGAVVLFSWPPLSWMGSGTLEWRYAVRERPDAQGQAIVVLSGSVRAPQPGRPVAVVGQDTYIRCQHAAWLFENGFRVPVLACGGLAGSDRQAPAYAEAMRKVLEGAGVPAEMIWVEDRSRSTYENALYAAEILRARGIRRVLLVTEALHMPRSAACFAKQGIDVVPAPCGFRASRFQWSFSTFLPSATAIRHNEESLHEWAGLIWYRLRGRI
jgi:uncharacterized SAM-binding protein YcdF (DUF218 family)